MKRLQPDAAQVDLTELLRSASLIVRSEGRRLQIRRALETQFPDNHPRHDQTDRRGRCEPAPSVARALSCGARGYCEPAPGDHPGYARGGHLREYVQGNRAPCARSRARTPRPDRRPHSESHAGGRAIGGIVADAHPRQAAAVRSGGAQPPVHPRVARESYVLVGELQRRRRQLHRCLPCTRRDAAGQLYAAARAGGAS